MSVPLPSESKVAPAPRPSMRRRRSRGRGSSILGGIPMAVVVLLAIGLAYNLIPKDAELVERLVEDGRHNRARQLALHITGGSADVTGEEVIAILLDPKHGDIDRRGAERIATLIQIINDPGAVHQMLESHSSRFSSSGRVHCLDALAHRSVQLSDPAFAADLYEQMWDIEAPSQDRLIDMVTACRFAGRPQNALDAFNRFLGDDPQAYKNLPHELRMIAVSLYREINAGSQAFDLLSAEFETAIDPDTRHQIMELMTLTATQSERIEDCMPVVGHYLETLDASSRSWRELLDQEAPHPSDADFIKYGTILAKYHEWYRRSDMAFEIYRKMAALGDLAALDRCVTIYPWIARQEDTTELLIALAPISERPHYTLLTARLEAERGRLERAIELMEPLLDEAPRIAWDQDPVLPEEHSASWLEFANVLNESGRYEDAISAYRRALESDPVQTVALKYAARLQVALGQYEQALNTLGDLPAEDHDAKSLEDYLMLAGALGDYNAEEQALKMRIERHAKAPRASDYAELSELWQRRGDSDRAIAVARSGLDALPDSNAMVLNLADQFVASGQADLAIDVLRRHDDPADTRFTGRLLNIATTSAEPYRILDLIERRPANTVWSPGRKLDLAALYEACHLPEKALQVYRQTQGGEPDVERIQATLAYARGDLRSAVAHQKNYLLLVPEPDYEGWMFLGDLQETAGNSVSAKKAYQQALDILHGKFNSTEANTILDELGVPAKRATEISESPAARALRQTLAARP